LNSEYRLRVYEGTGRILLSSYPYWRQLLSTGKMPKRTWRGPRRGCNPAPAPVRDPAANHA